MEPCAVRPIILSIHKNEGRSAMAHTVSCMRLALGIVASVLCVPDVKKAFSPPNLDGSVRFSGLSEPIKPWTLHLLRPSPNLPQRWLNWSPMPLSFGEIGPAVNCEADG